LGDKGTSARPVRPFALAVAAVIVVTAVPFGFRVPSEHLIYVRWNWTDIAINILLYIALGVCSPYGTLRTVLIAGAVSISAEAIQLISPGRFPGPLDVVANVAGALLGKIGARWLRLIGWNFELLRLGRRIGWTVLVLGIVAGAMLGRFPIRSDFSNGDPSFSLVLGDELNGNRRWRGDVRELAVVPATVGPALVQTLAREGPGSIGRHSQDMPALPSFEMHQGVDTRRGPLILKKSSSDAVFQQSVTGNRLSILLWIRTAASQQGGPARIITYSKDAYQRNFLIGQEHRSIVFRLRTPATGPNGSEPQIDSTPLLEPNRDTLVVGTYDGRFSRIYIDGVPAADVDVMANKLFAGLPALATAFLAGAFLHLGVLLIRPLSRTWLSAFLLAGLGLAWIASVPRPAYPGLSLRLSLVFLGGILVGFLIFRPPGKGSVILGREDPDEGFSQPLSRL
jgi:hypothetical protein